MLRKWPALVLSLLLTTAVAAAQPNLVIILADDLGFADVGWRGSVIKTPNLDALARSGAVLDRHYVQQVCSPTRAALMTGRYPLRHGLQVGVVRPWAEHGLPLSEKMLPQALKEAGYATGIFGKWHLGHFKPEYLPTRRGFDRQYGHYNGALDYFTHIRDGGFDWHSQDKACYDEGYSTHLIAREAVRFVEDVGGKQPFFLYVPFNAVHSPHQVPKKYTEAYGALQGERRVFAGMLAAMDEAVGQIVAAIDHKGLRDNTFFLFSSDNGGPNPGKVTDNGPLRAGKGTLYEGGVRVAACASWKGKIPAGSTCTTPIHAVDWFPTLAVLTGAQAPGVRFDGINVWPAVTTGAALPTREIVLNATPNAGAILVGDFKLVQFGWVAEADQAVIPKAQRRRRAAGEDLELFNLKDDPYEKTNLAASMPEKVAELRARIEHYRQVAVPPKVRPKPADFVSPKIWGETGS